jgi:hypothetical protein
MIPTKIKIAPRIVFIFLFLKFKIDFICLINLLYHVLCQFFCIFSDGKFNIGQIPRLTIIDIRQTKPHVFNLICDSGDKIQCGMSWGNGGAGNQNPRVLFKLLKSGESEEEGAAAVEGEYARGGSGESDEDIDEDIDGDLGWFITHEELAEGDTEGVKEVKELEKITINKDENTQIVDKPFMTLRSGLKYYTRKGGKKSTKKSSKTTKKGSKTTKKSSKKNKKTRKVRKVRK